LSDTTDAPGGGVDAIAPVPVVTPADTGTPVDVSQAASALSAWRKQKAAPEPKPAEPQPQAAPPQPSPEGADSDPQAEAPAEATETPDPAELPPIEAPRSWTTEEKERFKALPRELQAYLSEREQERDRDLRRRQNEAAEQRKALEADRQKAEQVRQEYEQKLPVLLTALQSQAGEFADVRTPADVMKLASEDPAKYLRYDAWQKQIGQVQAQIVEAQQRQHQALSEAWGKYAEEQDKLFADKVPDILDAAKAPKLRDSAVNALRDTGFTEQELAGLWSGQSSITLRDHRLQLLILDAVKYRDAKAKAATPPAKPVPPVQRPGTAPNKGAQVQAQIGQAAQKLTSAKGQDAVKAGVELLRAQRQLAR
jgi:hypothetical protein